MSEEWRPVIGAEAFYEVSSLGAVRSLRTGRLLALHRPPSQRYWTAMLNLPGGRKMVKVHTLVLTAFDGPRPDGLECRHLDGNPDNNWLSNLRWGTPSQNTHDAVRHGTHRQTGKTRCPAGHEYTPENTYINPAHGSRVCRECMREEKRRKYRSRVP